MSKVNNEEVKAIIAGKITLAVSSILNSDLKTNESIEFLKSLSNLLETVQKNNNNLDISNITEVFEKINSNLINGKKQVVFKEERKIEPTADRNSYNQISKEGNYKKNLTESRKQKENELEWRNVDFAVWCYSYAGGDGHFTSWNKDLTRSHYDEKQYKDATMNNFSLNCSVQPIFCTYDYREKMYCILYRPNVGFADLKDGVVSSRYAVPSIAFKFTIEELRYLALDQNTEIKLVSGKNLKNEINEMIELKKAKTVRGMEKVKVPFYHYDNTNESDIEFAKILYDFNSLLGWTTSSHNFLYKLVIDNSNNETSKLSFTDVVYLAKVFYPEGNEKEFEINVNNQRSNFGACGVNRVFINSSIVEKVYRDDEVLRFDIKDGLSSKENIEILSNYISKNGFITSLNKAYSNACVLKREKQISINKERIAKYNNGMENLLSRLNELNKKNKKYK